MLTNGSLFDGIGGFPYAARCMGIRTLWASEIDSYCRELSEKNFPEIESRYRYGDIRNINEKNKPPYTDIITTSPPCQPFSYAGKRGGAADDRHLWPETVRIFGLLRPRWVVCENVDGITTMAESRRLLKVENKKMQRLPEVDHYEAILTYEEKMLVGSMLQDLEEIGYEPPRLIDGTPVVFCIPAISVGAWHIRKRIWFIAADTHGVRQDSDKISNEINQQGIGQVQAGGKKEGIGTPGLFCNREQLKGKFPADIGKSNGVSTRLVESQIMAAGNAIVPQIAMQIFRYILKEHEMSASRLCAAVG